MDGEIRGCGNKLGPRKILCLLRSLYDFLGINAINRDTLFNFQLLKGKKHLVLSLIVFLIEVMSCAYQYCLLSCD